MSPSEIDPLSPQDSSPSGPEPPSLAARPAREYPEDIRTPWDWTELLIFAVVGLASYIILSTILVLAFYSRGISFSDLQNSAILRSLFAVLDTLLLWLVLLGYLSFTIRVRFRAPVWQTLGWRPFPGKISQGLAIAGCLAGGGVFATLIGIASNFVGKKAKLPIEAFFQDRRSIWMMMLMAVVVAPFVEETLFRGYLYPLFARTFGIGGGVLLTGLLFGGFHAMQLWGGWGQIALLILVGIVFTYVRAVSQTVLASYLLHVSYNTFLFVTFFVSTSGFHKLPVTH
jgi:membrane protease YdiL (CAAX protease family)